MLTQKALLKVNRTMKDSCISHCLKAWRVIHHSILIVFWVAENLLNRKSETKRPCATRGKIKNDSLVTLYLRVLCFVHFSTINACCYHITNGEIPNSSVMSWAKHVLAVASQGAHVGLPVKLYRSSTSMKVVSMCLINSQ